MHYILLATFLTGCMLAPTPIYIDEDEPEKFIIGAYDAVNKINDEVGKKILQVRITNVRHLSLANPVRSIILYTKDSIKIGESTGGLTLNFGVFVFIPIENHVLEPGKNQTEENVQHDIVWTIAHELGHAMCLSHTSNKNNLMFDGNGKDSTFDLTKRQKRLIKTCSVFF